MTREEAIEVMREKLPWLTEDTKRLVMTLVPELAEREDEKIRRTLVEYFGPQAQLDFIRGVPIQKIRDWLEKQKEQKPAEWGEDIIQKAVKEVGLTQHQIDWFKTNVFPPKPEWSEEDEDMLNCCISSIEEAKENRYAYKETDGDTSYDREMDWLKSLRPSWKPSEEQMNKLKEVIYGLCTCGNGPVLKTLYEDLKKLM